MKVTPRLSYANVVSTLCLILLIGGGAAFGASQLAKNSVGTKQLKKNAVTAAKIRKNAITTKKIAHGAVTGAKVASKTLTGKNIDTSTLGTVPNSAHATNADNAYRVDGLDANAFVPATQVLTPGHIVVDDPNPGNAVGETSALTTGPGPFHTFGHCIADFNGTGHNIATIEISGMGEKSAYSGTRSNGSTVNLVSSATAVLAEVNSQLNAVSSGQLIAVTEQIGQVASFSGSAEVGDPAGDCVFGVAAIGK